MNRRPYYISVTALLSDAKFVTAANNILVKKPFHQMAVEDKFWHFTVLPLVKIGDSPPDESMEQFAARLFDETRSTFGSIVLSKPIAIQLFEWHCYDSGLCSQFKSDDGSLNEVRERLRDDLKRAHDRLSAYKDVESEWKERNPKNSGNRCFGSIARAMCPDYIAALRWKEQVTEKIEIKFDTVYLLVSDEYLSNPSAHDPTKRIELTTSNLSNQ